MMVFHNPVDDEYEAWVIGVHTPPVEIKQRLSRAIQDKFIHEEELRKYTSDLERRVVVYNVTQDTLTVIFEGLFNELFEWVDDPVTE